MCVTLMRRQRVVAWRAWKGVQHFRKSRTAARASVATAKHARAFALTVGIACMQRMAMEHSMLSWDDITTNGVTYAAIAAADALLYLVER